MIIKIIQVKMIMVVMMVISMMMIMITMVMAMSMIMMTMIMIMIIIKNLLIFMPICLITTRKKLNKRYIHHIYKLYLTSVYLMTSRLMREESQYD